MRFLLAFLLSCSLAEAQTIPVNIVIVKHSYATPTEQQVYLRYAIERIKELGVTLKIKKLKIVSDTIKQNSLKQYTKRLSPWQNLAHYKGWCSDKEMCFMLLPPVFVGTEAFGGGVAQGICRVTGTAYAIARKYNSFGVNRSLSSITAMSHELGHLLGASHIDTKTIMNDAAMSIGELRLPWDIVSREQVNRCVSRGKI